MQRMLRVAQGLEFGGNPDLAAQAYTDFGKGRHAAALNFGDCMTYATAALARQPLLCRGDDFRKTDIPLA